MDCSFLFFLRPYTYKDPLSNCNSQEIASKVAALKNDLNKLENYESLLDQHKIWIEQSMRNTAEDIDSKKYMYLTHQDIINFAENDDTMLVINTPSNSDLEVQVFRYSMLRYINS